jgi:hypothetical protein
MSKKMKLNLEDLKVRSFVTTVENENMEKIYAGGLPSKNNVVACNDTCSYIRLKNDHDVE